MNPLQHRHVFTFVMLSDLQGHDGSALQNLSILQLQALSFANSLMSLNASERPTAQVSLAHHFLSPQSIIEAEADMRRCLPSYFPKGDILPVVLKGTSTTGALQDAASMQALSDAQPPSADSPFQPDASAQTQGQNMQHANGAALHLAQIDSPGSRQLQPAEASEGFSELPVYADSLQRHTSQESWGGASWLAAFTEAHLQGAMPGKQLAALDWVSEGSANSSEGTDIETQSAASSEDETDSLNSQLYRALKGRVQRLGSTAMGWSYYAAGAAFGTLLGLSSFRARQ